MSRSLVIAVSIITAVLGAAVPAVGQLRPAATAARELSEALVKRGGADAARELAEVGGEAAVREMLEASAREGGEALVQKTSSYALTHGPLAVNALRTNPARMADALDALSSSQLVRPALHAAAREPQVVTRIVMEFGGEGLEVVARHPGVGTRIVQRLGSDGISAGRALSTDQAISLARHADDIASLPGAQRSQLLAKIARSPAAILDYLEKHPRVLLTAAGAATVIALREDIMGTSELVIGPDGKPVAIARPGLIERLLTTRQSPVRTGFMLAVVVLSCALAAWALIRLWGVWRIQRLRYRHEAARLHSKSTPPTP